ncbi:MAG: CPBP family intramembrane metalloprotease, partial [Oscillospiraceae bacterium]|nr:CPBP family intramembrane metalloprotease [Oscillospiraceae bacterium]
RHFYPEYEGGLHGGDKVGKWLLIGIGYAVAFCAVTHIANAFITKDPVGFPAAVNCVGAIMAGVYEETIYRGMTASYLMRQWRANKEKKLLPVIVLSSAVFALIHMLNALNGQDLFFTVMQCINAFFMGCLMCALFMRSGNLIPGMIMHALYDFGQFMFVTLINEGGTVADGAFMSTSDIIQLVIMDVVYAALTMYLIRPSVREDIYRIWDMKWKDRSTEVL